MPGERLFPGGDEEPQTGTAFAKIVRKRPKNGGEKTTVLLGYRLLTEFDAPQIFYGTRPTFTNADKSSFSHGKYACKALMQTAKGAPVVISQSTDPDCPVWKVEHDFQLSCSPPMRR